jgi:xanthine/uracil permease
MAEIPYSLPIEIIGATAVNVQPSTTGKPMPKNFFGKLVSFFPPVVTGSVVTIIGMTLMPVAMNHIG